MMKNAVSTVATFVLFSLFLVTSAFGQMTPPEAGAVMMGTFQASFNVSKSGPDLAYSVTDNNAGGHIDATAWLTSGGKTAYTLDLNSAEFYMPCGWAKQMELSALVDLFAQAAIRKGTELGFSHAGSDCQNNIVDVYYASCVARNQGSGCEHLMSAPGAAYNVNGYSVCGPNYNPTISLVYHICSGSVCEGIFQSTCMTSAPSKPVITVKQGGSIG